MTTMVFIKKIMGVSAVLLLMIDSDVGKPTPEQLENMNCNVSENQIFKNDYGMCLNFTTYSEEGLVHSCFGDGHKSEQDIKDIKDMCMSQKLDNHFLNYLCKYACVEKYPELKSTYRESGTINVSPTAIVSLETCYSMQFLDFQTHCVLGKPVSCFDGLDTLEEQRASCEQNGSLHKISNTNHSCRYACMDRFQVLVSLEDLSCSTNESVETQTYSWNISSNNVHQCPMNLTTVQTHGTIEETVDKMYATVIATLILVIVVLFGVVIILILILWKMRNTENKPVDDADKARPPQPNNGRSYALGDPDAASLVSNRRSYVRVDSTDSGGDVHVNMRPGVLQTDV